MENAPPPGPVVIQGGDAGTRQGPTRTTCLEGKARKEQAEYKRKATNILTQTKMKQEQIHRHRAMDAVSEAGSQELIPDSAMASDLIAARGPAPVRKLEFEDVGTGSKFPKMDSPSKRYPPFSGVGRVFEHNDEELPEADVGADDIFWEESYSDIGDSDDEDLFRNEDAGPPEITESQLQELDREAMLTEINRLTAMKALARKPLQELEREEERERTKKRTAKEPSGLQPNSFSTGDSGTTDGPEGPG